MDGLLSKGLKKQEAYEQTAAEKSVPLGNLSRWFDRKQKIRKAVARVKAAFDLLQ